MSRYQVARVLPGADREDQIERAFWLRHIRIGFVVFLGETFLVMAYLGVTPHGPHRSILWITVSAWCAFGVVGLLVAPRLASGRHRAQFSAFSTILSTFAVGFVAAFDGGVDSPIVFLLFLPVGYAALAFPPLVTATCGVATFATVALVAITDADIHMSWEDGVVLVGVLVGATVVSVTSAVNRTHREHHERLLSEQMAHLAAIDSLTGCAVHRVFHQRLEEEIAHSIRGHNALSLLMIDVDDFKSVNDTYGHLVGDHVLATVGGVLRTRTRSFELVGRLGGDEFAVLMPDTEPSAAVTAAERFRQESSKAVDVPVTFSVGITGLDPSTPTAERMLDDADFALYQVKHAGRDGVTVFHSGPSTSMDQSLPGMASAPQH
jgi:diguanylate cyclase (GGDEF)-like protein